VILIGVIADQQFSSYRSRIAASKGRAPAAATEPAAG
jgi:hypothetical protein